jgi:hypothetical protein
MPAIILETQPYEEPLTAESQVLPGEIGTAEADGNRGTDSPVKREGIHWVGELHGLRAG